MDDDRLRDLMPLLKTLGATSSRYTKQEVRARLHWAPPLHVRRLAARRSRHGPRRQHRCRAGTTTIESKTNFLRGVRDGYAEATSRPLHVGRTVIVVETDVRDQSERLVARVLQTQLVLGG